MPLEGFGMTNVFATYVERQQVVRVLAAAALWLSSGCGDEAGASTEAVAIATEAIRGGWTPDPIEINRGGFVALVDQSAPNDAFCSGTVVANDLVLTARHCVADYADDVLALGIVLGEDTERQLRSASAISFPPDENLDYARIELKEPFYMPSEGGAPSQSGYAREVTDVSGETAVYCFGFGESPNKLTWAQLSLQRQDDFYIVIPNQFGQQLSPGDSGGGCFQIIDDLSDDLSNAPLISIARAGVPGLPAFYAVAERAVSATRDQTWETHYP
jgi:hypothetical protein